MKFARHAPLLLCFCISQALAGTPIQLHHDASPTVHVRISNIAGSVNVVGWDRNEVQVGGELGDGAKPLAITGSSGSLTVKVEAQSGSGWFNWSGDSKMSPTLLELHVPRAASVDVDVISAALVINGTSGGTIQVSTVSGKVRINAHTPSLKVDSVSGGIELAGHVDQARVQTVSGEILAPVLGSQASLQTISGRIDAAGGPWQKLTLSTVSGDAQLAGATAANGSVQIDSMSGDVKLLLPSNSVGRLHASSFSGDLRSDFGTPTHAEHGPGSSLDVRLGDGKGKIHVETFSGDLRIRKQD